MSIKKDKCKEKIPKPNKSQALDPRPPEGGRTFSCHDALSAFERPAIKIDKKRRSKLTNSR